MFSFSVVLFATIHFEMQRKLFKGFYIEQVNEYLYSFLDDKDTKRLILTHIYLLIGCFWPLVFARSQINENIVIALCGIASICVGDSFVYLLGGNHRQLVRQDPNRAEENSRRLAGLRFFKFWILLAHEQIGVL